MADYTQITDFSVKDGLTTGNAEKIILGADFDAEFSAISNAITSKYDDDDIASSAQAVDGTLDTVLMTPLQVDNVLENAGGLLGDIKDLTDPGADRILFWDDVGAGGVTYLTATNGLAISGTTLELAGSVAGYGLELFAGVLSIDADEITPAVISAADRILFADTSDSNNLRYDTWADLQASISITESQISDLGTYLESGDTAAALTITTLTSTSINVGNADTTITRDAAGQIAVEGDAVFSHDSGTYTSAKIFFSNGTEPTTQGANGDIFLVY